MPRAALALAAVLLAGVARAADPPPPPAEPKDKDPVAAFLAVIDGDKAFVKNEYKTVRAAYSKYFAATYGDRIKEALGTDADAVLAWLAANPDARDTLYTAIDPEVDDLPRCMEVFRDLFKRGPDKLKANVNLAVATAVVWDNPKGVYDYAHHARRTKSDMPEAVKSTDYLANYDLLTALDGAPKQALQNLPWEFLTHVVNHKTPADERAWAVKNYAARRSGVGKSYFDVEYDQMMLKTQSEVCKLNGYPYTLPSIKQRGGVCAMQADFAARVGKSLAVPAEYVRGESNSGGLHAWVMWAEVRVATKDRLDFTLMSEGRYLGDQYYVGFVVDPKTGKQGTDRDMERRLTVLGASPQNGRQADLLMRAFPLARDRKKLSAPAQAAYLRKVHDVFHADEQAWLALAGLYADGKLTDPVAAFNASDRAVTAFAAFPDFSWQLVPSLLTPNKDKAQRTRLYERLVANYEKLGRPDLACEARIALADYQVAAKEHKKAADGLAGTMRKFPSEGRYVPQNDGETRRDVRGVQGRDRLVGQVLPGVPPESTGPARGRGVEVRGRDARAGGRVLRHEQQAARSRRGAAAAHGREGRPRGVAVTSTRETTLARIRESGVVAVVRAADPAGLVDVLAALADGGVTAAEVTFTVPGALDVIRAACAQLGNRVLVGAGTVLDAETARAAVLAGAEFLVSPVYTPAVVQLARRYGKAVMPGAFTPTEVLAAWEGGADVVKVFPAEVAGPAFFRAMRGPLPQIPLMPSGGVDPSTAADFLAAGAACLSAGTSLVDPKLVAAKDHAGLTARARQFADIYARAPGRENRFNRQGAKTPR